MTAFNVDSDFNLLGGLPKGSVRQALDAEIANEGAKVIAGNKVILSNGDQVAWTPPPEKLVIPDDSVIKSIRHYFGARGYQPYPAWIYHPTLEPVLVKDAHEAAKYGIVYRKTSADERQKYGRLDVWDWEEGSQWRPSPITTPKFDPKNLGVGKNIPGKSQETLLQEAIMMIAHTSNGKAGGGGADPALAQALAMLAQVLQGMNKPASAEAEADDAAEAGDELTDEDRAANALTAEQEKILWLAEAERLGLSVDKRWGLERLRAAVEAASKPAA